MFATAWLFAVSAAAAPVVLPVEVVGESGTTASVTVEIPAARARAVTALWIQVHGLAFADMASVQVNDDSWHGLDNGTVDVAEPGRSFGGIGGGFATLKLTLALPSGTVASGPNVVRFRFNRTDGYVSGFRVIAFNFLTGDASRVLDPGAFAEDNPATWAPPLTDADSIRAGQQLWTSSQLRASTLPNAPLIRAHCSDCHARDGRDLKYFGFSNASIVARSRFHGLSDLQGRQIASYIRALPVHSLGRPWNPPYQPGPGLDAQPVANWAAGAGLTWALDNDAATVPFLFPSGTDHVLRSPDNVFRPDGNLNAREIPIALPLPDWNHWLPRIHPLDAWGTAFQASEFNLQYESMRRDPGSLGRLIASGGIVSSFARWTNARRAFLKAFLERRGTTWSPELGLRAYSTQLWQLTKTWELTQELGLEERGRELYGPAGDPRTWFNGIPAATAPASVNIPDGPSGMGGSALTNEYFDTAWYQLQLVVNSGNHRHVDRSPVDWVYMIGRFSDLYRESRRPEPVRLLISVIKAMQSTDPGKGPDDVGQGWRPDQTIDPSIMVNEAWAPIFEAIPPDARRVIAESFLSAWLDKNQQYPIGAYFRVGLNARSYVPPAGYRDLLRGRPWDDAPRFLAAGVDPQLVSRLQQWGRTYMNTAARFQYAPGGQSQPKSSAPKKPG